MLIGREGLQRAGQREGQLGPEKRGEGRHLAEVARSRLRGMENDSRSFTQSTDMC